MSAEEGTNCRPESISEDDESRTGCPEAICVNSDGLMVCSCPSDVIATAGFLWAPTVLGVCDGGALDLIGPLAVNNYFIDGLVVALVVGRLYSMSRAGVVAALPTCAVIEGGGSGGGSSSAELSLEAVPVNAETSVYACGLFLPDSFD